MLEKSYYLKGAKELSKDLLGKILVRKIDGKILKARIVETECYIGNIDKACHAYGGKITERIKPLYNEGGIAYVYFIYGLYHCFNIISGIEGEAEGVLIRAVEPINELDFISNLRYKKEYHKLTNYQKKNITNGPSKLCMAYDISKKENWLKLYEGNFIYIEEDEFIVNKIVEAKRIGIDYAEEAKDFLWRFYIEGNNYVSMK